MKHKNYNTNEIKARYLLIDTEASGFHPSRNGLLEVAALALDDNLTVQAVFQSYIQPPEGVEYNPQAMELTGITAEMIKTGMTYEVFCEEFITFIKNHFADKPIMIAQFYPFDSAYLNHVFEYCGYNKYLMDIFGNDFVDTKSIANVANMRARLAGKSVPFPITSLSKSGGLKDIYGITDGEHPAHSALGDVYATREVLLALLQNT